MEMSITNTHKRVGAVTLFVGAILILVGSFMVPAANDLGDIEAMRQAFSEGVVQLQVSALFMSVGFLSVTAGIVCLKALLESQRDGTLLRIAFSLHLIGIAVWMVGMSLDISYPAAIANQLAASEENREVAAALVAVLSPAGFGRGLFPINLIINWSAFGLLSATMLRRPGLRAAAWIGIVVGLAGLCLGVAMTFTGREAIISLFIALMTITIVWWLALAIALLRLREE